MAVDGFCRALADVASRCMQESELSGGLALQAFCEQLLVPLAEIHAGRKSEDVDLAGAFLAESECKKLLQRCETGMDKLFDTYAVEGRGRVLHWTPEAVAKFAQEFEIAAEVNNLTLQKIFQDCVHHEDCKGGSANEKAELSLRGFRLALVMISQKLFAGGAQSHMDRLFLLFSRINSVAATPSFGARLGAQNEPLLPIPRMAKSSSMTSLGSRPSSNRHNDGEDLSWAEVMTAQ